MEVMALSVRLKEEGASTVKSAIDKLKGSMKDLNLTSILAGAGLGVLVKQAVDMADQMRLLEGRLKLVTSSAGELQSVQDALRASSDKTRTSYESNVTLFARVARATQDVGIAQKDLLRFTELTSMSVQISGASAQEASAALIQLSQGLASNTLRGDEFRSVMEQIPAVAQNIAEGLGVTIGQLRAMAMNGELTAQTVIDAMLKMGDKIEGQFTKVPIVVSSAWVKLKDAIAVALAEVNKATGATDALANAMLKAGPIIENLGKAIANIIQFLRDIAPLVIAFGAAWVAIKLPLLISLVGALGNTVFGVAGKLSMATFAQKALNMAMNMSPVGVLITGLGLLTATVLGFADASLRAAEARDKEIANSPAYLAALDAVRERRAAATAEEKKATNATNAAIQATSTRIDNLIRLAELTRVTRSQYRELVLAESGYAAALRMSGLPLEVRVQLLERQKELQDAINAQFAVTIDKFKLSDAAMQKVSDTAEGYSQRIKKLREELAKEDAEAARKRREEKIARTGISADIPAPVAAKDLYKNLRDPIREQTAQLATEIQTTVSGSIANGLQDGLTAGIMAAVSSGRIADAWKAMSQAIIQNLASAMVEVALVAIGFAAKMKAIRDYMVLHPALAVAAAAAMLAFAYANGGKSGPAKQSFSGGMGGGGYTVAGAGVPTNNTVTRTVFGPTSATTAAGMTPRQPMNVTIIGPDDPKAQRAIQELIAKGNTRGVL